VPDPATRNSRRVDLLGRLLSAHDLKPSPEQQQGFLPYLNKGDPLADAVIEMYHAMPAGEGRKLVDRALEQGLDAVKDAPPALLAFFRQVEEIPLWLDREKLDLACDVTRRTGWFAELSLRNVSLMGGYLAAAAAKPLVFTGQLDRMAARRLVETGKFWVDVTTRGGMERFHEGFKSAVRVRLMHAQVRYMLNQSGRWDYAAWGAPINQADSMATVLEFSTVCLLGLRALGFRFTVEEREAVVHLWRYAGYLLGVDERILPACEADSMRALWIQYMTIGDADDDTRRLGQALNGVPLQQAGDHALKKAIARIETGYRSAFSRLILGNGNGDALGLPRSLGWTAAVVGTAPVIFSLETVRRRVPGANRLAVALGRLLHEGALPTAIRQEKADTTFTPVRALAR
jgi:hypothetical protein